MIGVAPWRLVKRFHNQLDAFHLRIYPQTFRKNVQQTLIERTVLEFGVSGTHFVIGLHKALKSLFPCRKATRNLVYHQHSGRRHMTIFVDERNPIFVTICDNFNLVAIGITVKGYR